MPFNNSETEPYNGRGKGETGRQKESVSRLTQKKMGSSCLFRTICLFKRRGFREGPESKSHCCITLIILDIYQIDAR